MHKLSYFKKLSCLVICLYAVVVFVPNCNCASRENHCHKHTTSEKKQSEKKCCINLATAINTPPLLSETNLDQSDYLSTNSFHVPVIYNKASDSLVEKNLEFANRFNPQFFYKTRGPPSLV
jgi:hypothetical protein